MWTLKDLDVDLQSGTAAWLPDGGGTVIGGGQLKLIELTQVPDSLRSRMVRIN